MKVKIAITVLISGSIVTALTISLCIIEFLRFTSTAKIDIHSVPFCFVVLLLCVCPIGQPLVLYLRSKNKDNLLQNGVISKRVRYLAEVVVVLLLCGAGVCIYQLLRYNVSVGFLACVICGYLVSVLYVIKLLIWNFKHEHLDTKCSRG